MNDLPGIQAAEVCLRRARIPRSAWPAGGTSWGWHASCASGRGSSGTLRRSTSYARSATAWKRCWRAHSPSGSSTAGASGWAGSGRGGGVLGGVIIGIGCEPDHLAVATPRARTLLRAGLGRDHPGPAIPDARKPRPCRRVPPGGNAHRWRALRG